MSGIMSLLPSSKVLAPSAIARIHRFLERGARTCGDVLVIVPRTFPHHFGKNTTASESYDVRFCERAPVGGIESGVSAVEFGNNLPRAMD